LFNILVIPILRTFGACKFAQFLKCFIIFQIVEIGCYENFLFLFLDTEDASETDVAKQETQYTEIKEQ
jgi:hypothetical protein